MVKIESVARMAGFRPKISLSFDQIMIMAGDKIGISSSMPTRRDTHLYR